MGCSNTKFPTTAAADNSSPITNLLNMGSNIEPPKELIEGGEKLLNQTSDALNQASDAINQASDALDNASELIKSAVSGEEPECNEVPKIESSTTDIGATETEDAKADDTENEVASEPNELADINESNELADVNETNDATAECHESSETENNDDQEDNKTEEILQPLEADDAEDKLEHDNMPETTADSTE